MSSLKSKIDFYETRDEAVEKVKSNVLRKDEKIIIIGFLSASRKIFADLAINTMATTMNDDGRFVTIVVPNGKTDRLNRVRFTRTVHFAQLVDSPRQGDMEAQFQGRVKHGKKPDDVASFREGETEPLQGLMIVISAPDVSLDDKTGVLARAQYLKKLATGNGSECTRILVVNCHKVDPTLLDGEEFGDPYESKEVNKVKDIIRRKTGVPSPEIYLIKCYDAEEERDSVIDRLNLYALLNTRRGIGDGIARRLTQMEEEDEEDEVRGKERVDMNKTEEVGAIMKKLKTTGLETDPIVLVPLILKYQGQENLMGKILQDLVKKSTCTKKVEMDEIPWAVDEAAKHGFTDRDAVVVALAQAKWDWPTTLSMLYGQ